MLEHGEQSLGFSISAKRGGVFCTWRSKETLPSSSCRAAFSGARGNTNLSIKVWASKPQRVPVKCLRKDEFDHMACTRVLVHPKSSLGHSANKKAKWSYRNALPELARLRFKANTHAFEKRLYKVMGINSSCLHFQHLETCKVEIDVQGLLKLEVIAYLN